ncbi:MAG: Cu-binding protein [Thelocarpon impressellum]|nr:MAG: Cu-binding protein [Thelocarpon impressellum]
MARPVLPARTPALLSSPSHCLRAPTSRARAPRQHLAACARKCSTFALHPQPHAHAPPRPSALAEHGRLRHRPFGTFPRQQQQYKTVEEARSRYRSGPFSWRAGLLFLLSGAGLIVYFRYEKARIERQRIAAAAKGAGAPKVGGPFSLVDHDGRPFTDADLRGRFALVYFGFTHCPDICPEELDKMAAMVDRVTARCGDAMTPVFITCDPARDTPDVVKRYLAEFHPALIGLTGTWEQVKAACKAYRVYFSTPPDVKPGQDYLVDHSIYFYLMDPQGDFVEAIGRQHSAEQAATIISRHVGDWRGPLQHGREGRR